MMVFILVWIDIVLLYTLYRYLRYSNWAEYLQGRLLVFQKLCLLMLSTVFLIGELTPPYPAEEGLVFLAAILIGLTVTGMLIALVDAQRQERKAGVRRRAQLGAIPDRGLWRTRPPKARHK